MEVGFVTVLRSILLKEWRVGLVLKLKIIKVQSQ